MRALLLAGLLPAAAPAAGAPAAPAYGVEAEGAPSDLEMRLAAAVRGRLEGAAASAALAGAARELAERVAAGQPDALDRPAVRAALARAGAADPAPAVFSASAPTDRLATSLAAGLPREEFSHLGLGAAQRGGRATAVLLASRRLFRPDPFPRDVAVGEVAELSGSLVGLRDPKVYATDPSGQARQVAHAAGARVQARVTFGAAGRWVLEVLGTGPTGPQVAALLVVSAGGAPLEEPPRAGGPEPEDPADAEEQVVGAVNALRGRRGLSPLDPDRRLRDAARRHSAAMLGAGQLAHVLADGADVGDRLRAAAIPFRRARENLARAPSARAAQDSLEESPAHLENLVAPDVTRIGVGLARGRRGGGEEIYLTQILVEPVDDSSDSRLRPETRVKEVLWAERRRLGRDPLLADPTLDALAGKAARAMLRSGTPGSGNWAAEAQGLGRQLAAVDAFVASAPRTVARSRNLGDPRLRRVGVGVAIGDDPRYGAGQLWIAVIYTD